LGVANLKTRNGAKNSKKGWGGKRKGGLRVNATRIKGKRTVAGLFYSSSEDSERRAKKKKKKSTNRMEERNLGSDSPRLLLCGDYEEVPNWTGGQKP